MSRRGENIYHRKDGRWEGRYWVGKRPDGTPIYKSVYGKRYNDVRRELLLRKAECCASQGKSGRTETFSCLLYTSSQTIAVPEVPSSVQVGRRLTGCS